MSDIVKVIAGGTVAFLLFLFGGAFGYGQKESDFIKHLDSKMVPYVSPMKTLEWKEAAP